MPLITSRRKKFRSTLAIVRWWSMRTGPQTRPTRPFDGDPSDLKREPTYSGDHSEALLIVDHLLTRAWTDSSTRIRPISAGGHDVPVMEPSERSSVTLARYSGGVLQHWFFLHFMTAICCHTRPRHDITHPEGGYRRQAVGFESTLFSAGHLTAPGIKRAVSRTNGDLL